MGESKKNASIKKRYKVDTYGGTVQVEWENGGAVTALGQLPFFIQFLKTGSLYDPWINDCPLHYTSPNAPSKRDVNGTVLLSVLSGHRRYAHITGIRFDSVNQKLLGMKKVMSEDAIRKAYKKIDETEGIEWLRNHLHYSYGPLLNESWILDIDTTVKPLYGKQEGAVIGYNPKKPGRPSHTYHTYMMANVRLVLDVEVEAGNHSASKYSQAGLWQLLDRIPKTQWPEFLRGDCGFGNENVIVRCEENDLKYLFKLRLTRNVKKHVRQMFLEKEWEKAGQGWEAVESSLKLSGWSKSRRVVILRREVKKETVMTNKRQGEFAFIEQNGPSKQYEYSVLVTSLSDELLTLAQHYRDRSDAENNFDELKNQWGWGGYTTQDLKRCRLMSKLVALIYNWWTLFVRLAKGEKHLEAITSRPLLLNGLGKLTRHSGQKYLTVTSTHGKTKEIQAAIKRFWTPILLPA